MSLADALATLAAAVATVDGVRVYPDVAPNLAPPAVVFGPPSIEFTNFNVPNAGDSTIQIYLVVSAGDRALERLVGLLDSLVQAVFDATDFAVTEALPGMFSTGGTELPCYVLTVLMGAS